MTSRITTRRGWLGGLLAVLLGTMAWPAMGDEPASKPAKAVLTGLIEDQAGEPLAEARVRVGIPAIDMRFIDEKPNLHLFEAVTDAKGRYRLELDVLAEPARVSIDVLKPGYQRSSGTPMGGGDFRRVEMAPGREAEASFKLTPAAYYRGVVVDEAGKPLPPLRFRAYIRFAGGGTGWVEGTTTAADGTFEIFNYEEPRQPADEDADKGSISISHPDYVDVSIEDLFQTKGAERTALRVVMPRGCQITGTVVNLVGRPVPGVVVVCQRKGGEGRKGALTDEHGRFAIKGVTKGTNQVSVRSLPLKQKADLTVDFNEDRDLPIRLQLMPPFDEPERYDVLGMQVGDLTPQIRKACDLRFDQGVLILDPGADSKRLGIGELKVGDHFWMVGLHRVRSTREFVDRILAEAAEQDGERVSIRVVYAMSRPEFDANNTQYLDLSREDLRELEEVRRKAFGDGAGEK
ncbi:carboxypeptidase-like regulatory domain-containing protein [Planctomyces sp. SH-PL14]|uniref:carboxypeptidase-like regulatory domain-containing protein n=1 Tax=Planctomyces sp. SH-PL14 TaxID=1632864 RepID=UPI00078C6501|nr:carboxypeptidase-like regulatory domain-containing protein [Planctomyces sp. SH-PL14]AMV22394.1 hypothetical protein VT03_31155 [Planctomyces sp. SH-PL14]